MQKVRPDLKVVWVPYLAVRILSPLVKVLQRFIFPAKKPIEIHDAFASRNYRTGLAAAAALIQKERKSSPLMMR